jgi:uncharacterized protein (TIGR03435 family)
MPYMRSWIISACLVSRSLALGQQPADKPVFEVASIKPSDPNPSSPMWIGMNADAGMVRYTNITLKDCIRAAYRVRDFQIEGPEWFNDARFEITAKLAVGAPQDRIPEMLQSLLAERFQLTFRHDMKHQSVYALEVGRGGPKLKPAEIKTDNQALTAVGPDGKPRSAMMFRLFPSGVQLRAPSASIASLVEVLSRFTERPVVDMTGLQGQYDLTLTFAPEITRGLPTGGGPDSTQLSSEPAPSVFDAVQTYGLKLERRKLPMDMLTVTHLEKTPTDN